MLWSGGEFPLLLITLVRRNGMNGLNSGPIEREIESLGLTHLNANLLAVVDRSNPHQRETDTIHPNTAGRSCKVERHHLGGKRPTNIPTHDHENSDHSKNTTIRNKGQEQHVDPWFSA